MVCSLPLISSPRLFLNTALELTLSSLSLPPEGCEPHVAVRQWMRTSWRDRDTAQSDEQLQQRANVDTEPGGTQADWVVRHSECGGSVTSTQLVVASHSAVEQRMGYETE